MLLAMLGVPDIWTVSELSGKERLNLDVKFDIVEST